MRERGRDRIVSNLDDSRGCAGTKDKRREREGNKEKNEEAKDGADVMRSDEESISETQQRKNLRQFSRILMNIYYPCCLSHQHFSF